MDYNDRQKFEHELINRRLAWLLSSQSILFAALGFVIGKEGNDKYRKPFLEIVSYLGIIISLCIFIGLFMGFYGKYINYKEELNRQKKENRQEYETKPLQWGVKTPITLIAFIPDLLMPLIFAATWAFMLWRLSRLN